MIDMRVVQAAVHQVVDMVAVGDRFMTAIRTVPVAGRMPFVRLMCCASCGIPGADLQDVLVHVIPVWRMKMAVVDVIGVPVVFDGRVTAALAVYVGMQFMKIAVIAHEDSGQ